MVRPAAGHSCCYGVWGCMWAVVGGPWASDSHPLRAPSVRPSVVFTVTIPLLCVSCAAPVRSQLTPSVFSLLLPLPPSPRVSEHPFLVAVTPRL